MSGLISYLYARPAGWSHNCFALHEKAAKLSFSLGEPSFNARVYRVGKGKLINFGVQVLHRDTHTHYCTCTCMIVRVELLVSRVVTFPCLCSQLETSTSFGARIGLLHTIKVVWPTLVKRLN